MPRGRPIKNPVPTKDVSLTIERILNAVGCISFLRELFPEDAFEDKVYPSTGLQEKPVNTKILNKDAYNEVQVLFEIINKDLRKYCEDDLVESFSLDILSNSALLESYVFVIDHVINSEKDPKIQKTTKDFLRSLILDTQSLKLLPESKSISCQIKFKPGCIVPKLTKFSPLTLGEKTNHYLHVHKNGYSLFDKNVIMDEKTKMQIKIVSINSNPRGYSSTKKRHINTVWLNPILDFQKDSKIPLTIVKKKKRKTATVSKEVRKKTVSVEVKPSTSVVEEKLEEIESENIEVPATIGSEDFKKVAYNDANIGKEVENNEFDNKCECLCPEDDSKTILCGSCSRKCHAHCYFPTIEDFETANDFKCMSCLMSEEKFDPVLNLLVRKFFFIMLNEKEIPTSLQRISKLLGLRDESSDRLRFKQVFILATKLKMLMRGKQIVKNVTITNDVFNSLTFSLFRDSFDSRSDKISSSLGETYKFWDYFNDEAYTVLVEFYKTHLYSKTFNTTDLNITQNSSKFLREANFHKIYTSKRDIEKARFFENIARPFHRPEEFENTQALPLSQGFQLSEPNISRGDSVFSTDISQETNETSFARDLKS